MIYDEYIAYCVQYEKIYGQKTIVIMEVGSFFECYAVENELVKEGAPISEICGLLHIQSTRKNKSISEVSRTNPLLCGFPSASLSKFMSILIQHDYTVVVVEQVTPPPNPERKVTQICSPSTYLEPTSTDARWLLCIYLTNGYDRSKKQPTTIVSIVMMENTTGETRVLDEEVYTDSHRMVQEMHRIITSFPPKEMMWIADHSDNEIISTFRSWTRSLSCCVHDHSLFSLKSYQQLPYQTALLRTVYPNTGMLSPIEYVSMERHVNGLVSYCYLLYFVMQHNEQLVSHLQKPHLQSSSTLLRLTHTALDQLNITSPVEMSLLKLLNRCVTPMGKRYFVQCLVSPCTSVNEIVARQEAIHQWQTEKRYHTIRTLLQPIKDMERLFRRIMLQSIQPCEMIQLYATLEQIQRVQTAMDDMKQSHPNDSVSEWLEFMSRWDMDIMKTCTLSSCSNFYKHHDILTPLRNQVETMIATIKDKVDHANRVSRDADAFKLEQTDRGECTISITKRRFESYVAAKKGPVFTSQPYTTNHKTMLKVYFEGMMELQDQLMEAIQLERVAIVEAFRQDVLSFHIHASLVERLSFWIASIDVWSTSANNADSFHYVCPTVMEGDVSSFTATDLRHPLIEHIQKEIPYVPNDVTLSGSSSMLLHGINAVGKSSFMKSIGMAIVMAQAGMYVPASSCTVVPYTQLFTRLPCGDNLFKGHSTFVAEMLDIKSILSYSDQRTIVIGDEVCSGTETVSAIAIVASAISSLSRSKTSFIFATHLFEVSSLELVTSIPTLSVHHMSVSFDTNRKQLVYDRKVKAGTGTTLYGLEVCRSLDLDPAFLAQAQSVRTSYMDLHVLPDKRSRYASTIVMSQCAVCHQSTDGMETHHIKEQHLADTNGFVDHRHKNHPSNLIVVCTSCHDSIHAKNVSVDGYKMTSNGVTLQLTEYKTKDHPYLAMIQSYQSRGKSIAWIAKELGITSYKVQTILGKK